MRPYYFQLMRFINQTIAEFIHGRNVRDELAISLFRIRKVHSSHLGPGMG